MPRIAFTVTNDLVTDQRMQRICSSLAAGGYEVTLIGAGFEHSLPLSPQLYRQERLPLAHHSGKLFYISFNHKLYHYLKNWLAENRAEPTAICAIDLDTILPVWLVCKDNASIERVYDAHEYFTQMTEVLRRPWIRAAWTMLERNLLPNFPVGYTVNESLAELFRKKYGLNYQVIRNLPKLNRSIDPALDLPPLPEKFLLYQGAVNEGRAFEQLIPAMQLIELPLVIIGDGNYYHEVEALIAQLGLAKKVLLLGKVSPQVLHTITPKAELGFTLFTQAGHNQYHSLANRFFDYIMAGIPQICVDYPEYRRVNDKYEVALLINNLSANSISEAVNKILSNNVLYTLLQSNALRARNALNWENEEQKLMAFWRGVFG